MVCGGRGGSTGQRIILRGSVHHSVAVMGVPQVTIRGRTVGKHGRLGGRRGSGWRGHHRRRREHRWLLQVARGSELRIGKGLSLANSLRDGRGVEREFVVSCGRERRVEGGLGKCRYNDLMWCGNIEDRVKSGDSLSGKGCRNGYSLEFFSAEIVAYFGTTRHTQRYLMPQMRRRRRRHVLYQI